MRPTWGAGGRRVAKAGAVLAETTTATTTMAARRAKRIKLDGSVLLLQSPATTKQLTRLAKGSLCALAILWTTEQHPAALRPSQRVVESDPESDEEVEVEEDLKAVYEVMRDQASLGKSRVVERIQKDWVSSRVQHWLQVTDCGSAIQSDGFTYRQLAQLDVQCKETSSLVVYVALTSSTTRRSQ